MNVLSYPRILNVTSLVLTIFFCSPVIGQSVEKKAQFEGNLNRFISTQLNYPKNMAEHNVEGLTVVSFNVTETGDLDSIKVEASPHIAFTRQVLSALEETNGKWTPAKLNNEPLTRRYKVIVDYSVQQKLPAVNEAVEMFEHASKLFDKGKTEKALKILDDAIEMNPYYFKFHQLHSQINMALGNEAQAKEDLDQSFKMKKEVMAVCWVAAVKVVRTKVISTRTERLGY